MCACKELVPQVRHENLKPQQPQSLSEHSKFVSCVGELRKLSKTVGSQHLRLSTLSSNYFKLHVLSVSYTCLSLSCYSYLDEKLKMPLLSNDGFLTKLSQLFSDASVRGSVWITIKQGECILCVSRNVVEVLEVV